MLITLDEYKKGFHQWDMTFWCRDCVVRNKDIFVFVTEPSLTDEQVKEEEENGWSSDLRPKGIMIYIRYKDIGKQWSGGYHQNWAPMVIGASQKPASHSVSIERIAVYPSFDRRCFVTGSGPAYEDVPLAGAKRGDFARGHIAKLKPLEGHLYACGGNRSFGKRLGKGQWQSFSQDIPYPEKSSGTWYGFDDFDGWSETDIYAAGGEGDVWHYDGREWRQIPFPSNLPLNSVCCGGDGNVYISGYGGDTFVGRGDRWKMIRGGGMSLPFRDMVWYEDRVWCTSDYGLWTIHNGRIARPNVPATVSGCCGNLSVGDGVLLLAGLCGAVFKENGQWHEIVLFSTMEKLLALEEAEKKEK
jgi:hypothetical protein